MTCVSISLLDFRLLEGRKHVLFLTMSPRLGIYTYTCSIKACSWAGSFCLNNPTDRGTHGLWYSFTSRVCMNFPQGLPLPHRYQSFHSTNNQRLEAHLCQAWASSRVITSLKTQQCCSTFCLFHLSNTHLSNGPLSSVPLFQRLEWSDLYRREMRYRSKNEMLTILLVEL